jgi:hypothetical protein
VPIEYCRLNKVDRRPPSLASAGAACFGSAWVLVTTSLRAVL